MQRFPTFKNTTLNSGRSSSWSIPVSSCLFRKGGQRPKDKFFPCCTGLILRKVFFVLKSVSLPPPPLGLRHVTGKIQNSCNNLSTLKIQLNTAIIFPLNLFCWGLDVQVVSIFPLWQTFLIIFSLFLAVSLI